MKAKYEKSKKSKSQWRIRKVIGSTKYDVSLNFSETSSENINDKIFRLLEKEISENEKSDKA